MPDEKSDAQVASPETDIVTEEPDYTHLEHPEGTDESPSGEDESATGAPPVDESSSIDSETAPSPGSSPPPAEPEWSNEHFGLGRVLGLSDEEVRAFGTPERFEEVMGNASRAFGKDQTLAFEQNGMNHIPRTAADVDEADDVEEPEIQQFTLSDPELYDDEIVGMAEHFNQQVAQLQQELRDMRAKASTYERAEEQRQTEAAAREFDIICDRMDEETFGRGRLNDLDREQAMRRVDLANEVSRLGHGYIARGEDVPPLDQLADKAAGSLFGDRLQKRGLQAVSERTQRVANQATAVPTQQESRPLSGKEAAIQAASNWQQENWGHVVNDPNEFPD